MLIWKYIEDWDMIEYILNRIEKMNLKIDMDVLLQLFVRRKFPKDNTNYLRLLSKETASKCYKNFDINERVDGDGKNIFDFIVTNYHKSVGYKEFILNEYGEDLDIRLSFYYAAQKE